jgi:hypothetical protein
MLLCIDLLMSLLLCSFLLHTNAWAMPSSKTESTQPLQKQRGAAASSRRLGLRMFSFVRQPTVSTHALSLQLHLSYMTVTEGLFLELRAQVQVDKLRPSLALAAAHQPVQTANLPEECVNYLLVAPPQELETNQVQIGQRLPDAECEALQAQRRQQWYDDMFLEHVMPLSHPIWPEWKDSNKETWPKELQLFWYGISWSGEPEKVATGIRKYYAEDKNLSALADWLEYWTSQGLKVSFQRKPYNYEVTQSQPALRLFLRDCFWPCMTAFSIIEVIAIINM